LVWFSWRPLSPDPGDDLILDAAIVGGCDFVVSFNERLPPVGLLKLIGEIE